MKKVNINTLLLIAGGIIAIRLGGKLFETLGISQSAADRSLMDAQSNPDSFWNPLFWDTTRKRSGKAMLLKTATMSKMWDDLNNAFSWYSDAEDAAISVFKVNIKFQTQLSFFSWYVQREKGVDLITWLAGGSWPSDRLDANEINIITNYVKSLPVT